MSIIKRINTISSATNKVHKMLDNTALDRRIESLVEPLGAKPLRRQIVGYHLAAVAGLEKAEINLEYLRRAIMMAIKLRRKRK